MSARVSVIIPVYNSAAYLPELLESLVAQDLGPGEFDVIAVDDGSTDGSGALLDEFCRVHPGFRVIHQDNSRRPGRPRNVGLRHSDARYVFFADADDVLATSCLRQLVAFADERQSDVVIPRLTALDGRTFPTAVYERTIVDADLPTAFKTLFPQKLYRRQLLIDHDIWFPEGRRLDDGMFNAQVYVHARRISILSEDDYYYLRARPDGGQLSQTEKNPATYTESVADIARLVRAGVSDSAVADEIVLELYRRKCLIQYEGRFARSTEAVQKAWIGAHQSFAREFVSAELESRLPSPYREHAHFVRLGDRTALVGLRAVEEKPRVIATIIGAEWAVDGLRVAVDASVIGRLSLPQQVICKIVGRTGEGTSAFPIVRPEAEPSPYGGTLAISVCCRRRRLPR